MSKLFMRHHHILLEFFTNLTLLFEQCAWNKGHEVTERNLGQKYRYVPLRSTNFEMELVPFRSSQKWNSFRNAHSVTHHHWLDVNYGPGP